MIGVSIVSVTLSPRDAWRCVLAPILEYALINIFPTRFQCLIVEKSSYTTDNSKTIVRI